MIEDIGILMNDFRESILVDISGWKLGLQPMSSVIIFRIPSELLSFSDLVIFVTAEGFFQLQPG
jgi:hypothetical protein